MVDCSSSPDDESLTVDSAELATAREAAPYAGRIRFEERRLVVLVLGVAALAGCSSSVQKLYPGPTLSDNDVATVRPCKESPLCFVQFVDGDPVEVNAFNHRWRQYPTVLVKPGLRNLSIALQDDSPFATWYSVHNCVIRLDAKAGHEYQIVARWVGHDRWDAAARDPLTGEETPCRFVR